MAQDINHFICVGRLTKDLGSDPNGRDFGYLQNGTCKGTISIAVNNAKKQGDQWIEETNYFNIVIWGKTAENLKPYLTKGQQVVVDAHLKQDKWTDQQGNNHSQISIVADNIELVGGKRDGQQNGAPRFQPVNNQNGFQNQSQNNQPVQQNNNGYSNGGFQEDFPYPTDSDIPF